MAKAVIVVIDTQSGVIALTENELKKLCAVYKQGEYYFIGRYGTNKSELKKAAGKK